MVILTKNVTMIRTKVETFILQKDNYNSSNNSNNITIYNYNI